MRADQWFFRYGVYTPTVWLRGEPLGRCLRELEASQGAPLATLREQQERKLTRLVQTAAREVPYFQERIDLQQLPRTLTISDVRRLPLLTKDELRHHGARLRNPAVRRVSVKTTGGSTGQAVTISKSRLATAYELAAMWRGWGWAGIRIGDRQARFWGVPLTSRARLRGRLVDLVSHRRRFTAFGVTADAMRAYTQALDAFRPDFVYGYVSFLAEYAQFLSRHGRSRFRPKAVIATSEVLTRAQRDLIAEGFSAPVFEEYGCGELGNIAHECEHGRMHLSSENLLVEVLPPDGTTETRHGELVITELNNDAFPLIRYRLGDFGELTDEPCPCGRTLPVLKSIAGRAYDLVYNREGRLFHGEFFMYIFEDAKRAGHQIDKFQVIQKDVDHFVIRVKPGPGYGDAAEDLIARQLKEGYGSYANIAFERVDDIPRERSGKMRLIVGAPRTDVISEAGS